MVATAPETIAERIESLSAVDAPAEKLGEVAKRLAPEPSRRKDLLSGTWLGHPVHPVLTDVVVGSFLGAVLLDVLGGRRARPAAERLIEVGLVAALPTALSGLSDWADLHGGPRRAGVMHALGNTTALALFAASLAARRRRRHGAGAALGGLGAAVAMGSAWIGGHLSFSRGVGVNQTAFESLPEEWTAVARAAELPDATLVGVTAEGAELLLVRHGGRVHAMHDRCSHRGCSLHEGALEGELVRCPCHGSAFRLDGTIASGPATSPQPVLEVREREGALEVRRRRT